MESKFLTRFSQAWEEWKELQAYKDTVILLKNKGMNQPYIDNVIFLIFSAGYNSN